MIIRSTKPDSHLDSTADLHLNILKLNRKTTQNQNAYVELSWSLCGAGSLRQIEACKGPPIELTKNLFQSKGSTNRKLLLLEPPPIRVLEGSQDPLPVSYCSGSLIYVYQYLDVRVLCWDNVLFASCYIVGARIQIVMQWDVPQIFNISVKTYYQHIQHMLMLC